MLLAAFLLEMPDNPAIVAIAFLRIAIVYRLVILLALRRRCIVELLGLLWACLDSGHAGKLPRSLLQRFYSCQGIIIRFSNSGDGLNGRFHRGCWSRSLRLSSIIIPTRLIRFRVNLQISFNLLSFFKCLGKRAF